MGRLARRRLPRRVCALTQLRGPLPPPAGTGPLRTAVLAGCASLALEPTTAALRCGLRLRIRLDFVGVLRRCLLRRALLGSGLRGLGFSLGCVDLALALEESHPSAQLEHLERLLCRDVLRQEALLVLDAQHAVDEVALVASVHARLV